MANEGNMRVVVDPDVMSGQPCFAGTRIPIESVAINLRAGYSTQKIEAAYPTLPQGWREIAEEWNATMDGLASLDRGEGIPMDQVMERLAKKLEIGLGQMDRGEFSERSVTDIASAVMAEDEETMHDANPIHP
jgi:hypothetical protein